MKNSRAFDGSQAEAAARKPLVRASSCVTKPPAFGADGTIAGSQGIMQDVTQSKQAEERLRLQTSALEAAANGIVITDCAGRILWVNPAFTRLTGYSAAEVIGRKPLFLMSGEQDRSFFKKLWKTIHGGEVWHGELINRRRDGTLYDEEMTITPVRTTAGKMQNFIAVQQDISQRKQDLAELARERDLWRALMDNIPDFIYFKDAHSRFIRINLALAQHLELANSEDATGKMDTDFYSPGMARQRLVDDWRVFATGKPLLGLVEESVTAHRRIWVSTTKVPIRDASGQIIGLAGISRNVTELKQATDELLAQRESFRALTDNVPDGIARIDADLRYLYVNRVLENIFKIPAADFLGRTLAELKLPAWKERSTAIRQVFSTGKTIALEFSGQCPAGTRHWETRLVPEFAASGGVQHVLAITRDVTEQRQVEQNLRDANAIQNLILENSILGIVWVRDRKVVWANSRTAELVGLPLEEVRGASTHIFFPSDEAYETLGRVAYPVMARGERSDNTFQMGRNGSWFWCRFIGKALNPEAPHDGSIWMLEDISDLKKAEQTRLNMEVQLRQAQKLEAIGQLAAGIAHEINTPTQYVGDNTRFLKDAFDNFITLLRGYGGMYDAAKRNALTPELLQGIEQTLKTCDVEYFFLQIPQAIQETLEGVERVTTIVRAMKEFSHPGGNEKTAADINKAIESTTTVARNEWKYVSDLKLELDPNLPLVPCFIGEFNQAILNLVINAAHAIGDVVRPKPGTKGVITIQTRRDGDYVEVRVADTGTGIAEANRQRIFEPFFTTKDVGKGTGQGLTIVYTNIVKKHGGTVTFETEVGRGTTFVLRLPFSLKNPAGEKTPAGEPAETTPAA